ncbi:MAG: peptidyl-prolyl cis-trans isomerase [Clostridium sp.]|jgi:hypothetical protein|nr:peptidyl-prolyl cis-trans isomerase [Clostridium sp.]
MPKKETKTEAGKIVTRYERRMRRRKEQEEKEKRQKKLLAAMGAALLTVLACVAVSFPVRTVLATNQAYVEINGEKVTRVEFDYYYNRVKDNYISQYGTMMSAFGLDVTGDFSTQLYSGELTWKDFFDEMAVDYIKQGRALLADARQSGFAYDTKEDYAEYEAGLKEAAQTEGVAFGKYLKATFGSYATLRRISGYIENDLFTAAYYEKLAGDKAPTEQEIQAYYEENRDSYDSVDYRLAEVAAQLPTEPTAGAEAAEDQAQDTETAGEAYEPTEEEIADAMAKAKEEADQLLQTVASDGELYENAKQSGINSSISGWLYDAARKEGESTVIEDSVNSKYLVVCFVKRYREETPIVSARAIAVASQGGQAVLEEWQNGAATEESFIELYHTYNIEDSGTQDEDGLFSDLVRTDMEESIADWLFAPERRPGDVTVISLEGGYDYVFYFVETGEPEWSRTISNILTNETMMAYVEQLTETAEVKDPKGNLDYLAIKAAQEAAAAESAAAEASEAAAAESAAAEDLESAETETEETEE